LQNASILSAPSLHAFLLHVEILQNMLALIKGSQFAQQ
jgi:hypothetical protein